MEILFIIILVIAVVACRKFCEIIGAPYWFAKFLFICFSFAISYLLADVGLHAKPDSFEFWFVLIVIGSTIGAIGVESIDGYEKDKIAEEKHHEYMRRGDNENKKIT